MAVDSLPVTLADLLNNTLVLRQTAPYIPVTSLVALSSASQSLRSLIHGSPEAFRHLNLASLKSAIIIDSTPIDSGGISWRTGRMDESLTEEDFFSGPLRGIFGRLHRCHILEHVKTLVLDGLSVPAEVVREIIADEKFNVKILSIREVKNLNERKLQQVLHYAVRRSRAEGTPKLKALYLFSPKDASPGTLRKAPLSEEMPYSTGVMSTEGAQIGAEWYHRSEATLSLSLNQRPEEKWYRTEGKVMKAPSVFWAETIQACEGIIAFDVVLCRGPRHNSIKTPTSKLLPPTIATIALSSKGCETCGSCPERPAVLGQDPVEYFPLLTPPPTHASTVRAAQYPMLASGGRYSIPPSLILRCEDCMRGRWCERCNKWWCEDCYEEPVSRAMPTELQQIELREDMQRNGWNPRSSNSSGAPVKGVHRDCFECGRTCDDCKDISQRRCQSPGCNSEYCVMHAEGSTETRCDWCGYRGGRRTRELY